MKRKLFAVILIALSIFSLAGCSTETEETSWKDLFQVTYTRIDEAEYADEWEKLEDMLNGTYIMPGHEYKITNTTNDILRNCRAIFQVSFHFSTDSFEYDSYVGTLQQGETKVIKESDTGVELEIQAAGYEVTDRWELELLRIEYEY